MIKIVLQKWIPANVTNFNLTPFISAGVTDINLAQLVFISAINFNIHNYSFPYN
jgi:hypothetical protein